jgi:hypothetical protein
MEKVKQLLSNAEATEFLGVAKNTLACWRLRGKGPKFLKIGSKIAYDRDDLQEFIDANRFGSNAERHAAAKEQSQ